MVATNPEPTNEPRVNYTSYVPLVAFGFFIVFGGVLLSALTPGILPQQASAEAAKVDDLFRILLMIGGGVFILVQGLLVYSVIRFRNRAGDTTDGPPIHGNTTLEIVWTIIPAIIVIFLAIISYDVWVSNQTPKENENMVNGQPVPVLATGFRFAWNFEYETPETDINGEPITITSEILNTYAGQNVKLDMVTNDVIHSFWIPAMRVKQDLLPGRTTEIRFTPQEPEQGWQYTDEFGGRYNEYRIVCTELCGGGHGQMFTYIRVFENEEAYLQGFYEPTVAALREPPEDPVLLGEQILASGEYPCASCHILDSQGWEGLTGPNLNGIGERAARRVSGLAAEEYLIQSLRQPNSYVVPGYNSGLMNYFGPSPDPIAGQSPYVYMPTEDVIAIVSYLCQQVEDGGESACDIDPAHLQEIAAQYE